MAKKWAQHFTLVLLANLAVFGALPEPALGEATTEWVLSKGFGADVPRLQPSLHMRGTALSGSTGCNLFTASIQKRANNAVAIERVSLTRKMCDEQRNKFETALVKALEQTQSIQRTKSTLIFSSDKNLPLLVWQKVVPRSAKRAKRTSRHKHPLKRGAARSRRCST